MKNKTPLQELIQAIYDLPPFEAFKWMEANKERLVKEERDLVAIAWENGFYYCDYFGDMDEGIPGSKEAYNYFDTRYGNEK